MGISAGIPSVLTLILQILQVIILAHRSLKPCRSSLEALAVVGPTPPLLERKSRKKAHRM